MIPTKLLSNSTYKSNFNIFKSMPITITRSSKTSNESIKAIPVHHFTGAVTRKVTKKKTALEANEATDYITQKTTHNGPDSDAWAHQSTSEDHKKITPTVLDLSHRSSVKLEHDDTSDNEGQLQEKENKITMVGPANAKIDSDISRYSKRDMELNLTDRSNTTQGHEDALNIEQEFNNLRETLLDNYKEQVKLSKENKYLEELRCQMENELLIKDSKIEELQQKFDVLQQELNQIQKARKKPSEEDGILAESLVSMDDEISWLKRQILRLQGDVVVMQTTRTEVMLRVQETVRALNLSEIKDKSILK